MVQNPVIQKVVFFICLAACLWISPPIALLLGLVIAQVTGRPYLQHNKKVTTMLLQLSIVGLGFGMNLFTAISAGKEGILFTIASIFGTLALGTLLGYLLKMDKKTSHLISSGTAICGGSAIAAVGPVINAEEKQMSVSLGIVFILNAVALFIFPIIGHALSLTQHQFGLWCAIAIHDTSSVVGAAGSYGKEALAIATTVKLARALWIIPLAIVTGFFFRDGKQKIKIPYFIGGFILAMAINSYVPAIQEASPIIVKIAKIGMTITLFLIGAGLSKKAIASVGIKPFIQGLVLWVVISLVSLWAILSLAM